MRFSTITPRQAVAALGVCFAFLLVAGPASARPDGYQPQLKSDTSDAFTRYVANHRAHEDQVAKAALGDGDQSDPVSSYLADLRAEQAYNASSTGIPDSVADLVAKNAAAASEPLVVPYLSHGEGVLVGEDGLPESIPTVIPYLSHGVGVTGTDATLGLRDKPDGFQPQLHTPDSPTVVNDGFDWETTGVVTAGIAAAMLLALMSTIALRDRRGLKSA
jgi:hypothetical protein